MPHALHFALSTLARGHGARPLRGHWCRLWFVGWFTLTCGLQPAQGTTFSGFAYAFASVAGKASIHEFNTADVSTNYDWPEDAKVFGKYPKTLTALYYSEDPAQEPLWGWSAFKAAAENKNQKPWQYQHRFKLHLAGGLGQHQLPPLPPGKTAEDVMADFLRLLARFALAKITSLNVLGQVTARDAQWSLTVPATWDQASRAAMERIAQTAGLIRGTLGTDNGGSIHPIRIVLEPEAASVYCYGFLHRTAQESFAKVFV